MRLAALVCTVFATLFFPAPAASGTWQKVEVTGYDGDIDVIAIDSASSVLMVAGQEQVGGQRYRALISRDGGTTWTDLTDSLPPDSLVGSMCSGVIDPSNADVLYVGFQYGKVYRTEDGGRIWEEHTPGFSRVGPIEELSIDPLRPCRILASSYGVYLSENSGDQWSPSEAGMANSWAVDFAWDHSNSRVVYAACEYRGREAAIYCSLDGGLSWQERRYGIPLGTDVRSIDIDPRNPAVLYASTIELDTNVVTIYRSQDSGRSWSVAEVLPDLGEAYPGRIRVNPVDPRILYLAFANSPPLFYRSSDSGQTWSLTTAGLPDSLHARCNFALSTYWPVRLLLCSADGLWSYVDSAAVGTEDKDRRSPAPDGLQVIGIGRRMRVEYTVNQGGYAQLQVYDPLGAVVQTIVDGYVFPGTHRTICFDNGDARYAPSGIYFIRFATSQGICIRKVLRLR